MVNSISDTLLLRLSTPNTDQRGKQRTQTEKKAISEWYLKKKEVAISSKKKRKFLAKKSIFIRHNCDRYMNEKISLH